MNEPTIDPATQYWDAVRATAERDLGSNLGEGTIVIPSRDREGSTVVVAYPGSGFTLVWCAPAVADRLAELAGPIPLTGVEFLEATKEMGAKHVGDGHHRVLPSPVELTADPSTEIIQLDRDNTEHRALIQRLVDASSEDDLDESELEMDNLDSAIVVALRDGEIASFASARPWEVGPRFDDIGVITHPDHRGHRLGSQVVAELCRRQQSAGRLMFYNCDVQNAGSNRLAETVGFTLVCRVTGVSLPAE